MYDSLKTAAIIPAAGSGKRMGTTIPKQFLALNGKPILYYTLKTFYFCPWVDELIVVGRPEDRKQIEFILEGIECEDFSSHEENLNTIKKVVWSFVEGGEERQESVFNGLNKLSKDVELVMIHDGARPFVTEELIEKTLEEAKQFGAAVLGVPVKDTIKRVSPNLDVVETLLRSELYAAQTPQTFKLGLLKEVYQKAAESQIVATDDASLLEVYNIPVRVVLGSYDNFKITTPEDIFIAEHMLKERERHVF